MDGEPRKNAGPAPPATPNGLLHQALTSAIISAMYTVHREVGVGFLESVYEAALVRVLRDLGLRAERQHALDVVFRSEVIATFRADVVVERRVLVELKVAKALTPVHEAQVLNYLRASGLQVGLLVNFGARVQFRRLVLERGRRGPAGVGPRSGPPRSSAVPRQRAPAE